MERLRLNGRRVVLFLVSLVLVSRLFAISHNDSDIRQSDNPGVVKINRADIKTVSLRNNEDFMSPPILKLSGDNILYVNFDILGDDKEYLCFRLIHCNSDWQPSSLVESEYLSGFNEEKIDDYEFSYNTYAHYVNYNIRIPGRNEFLHSGNYLLQIYPENNPEEIILEVPFYVSENLANISGGVSGKTDIGFNDKFQQLELEIELPEEVDPLRDIKVIVTQNNRPETSRILKMPSSVSGNIIKHSHSPELIFESGNEYRRFETVRADYAGMGVDSVRFVDDSWHAWLRPDESRKDARYVYDETQHGRFKIDEYNSNDPDLSADYVNVHFQLDSPYISGSQVYIDGDFTGHRFDNSNRMVFNPQESVYEATLRLKQGSYNYQYVVVDDITKEIRPDIIEGSNYETRNEYLVRVYMKKPGDRAERLIGYKVLTID